MSAIKTWNLACDHAGCTAVFNSGRPSAQETRADAARAGWTYELVEATAGRQWGRPTDLCPAHPREEP